MFKIPKLDNITERLNEYLDSRIQLMKLDIKEEMTLWISGITFSILTALLISLMIMFLSIAGALWLSEVLQSHALGFVSIGLVYGLLFLIVRWSPVQERLKKAIFESIDKAVVQKKEQGNGK